MINIDKSGANKEAIRTYNKRCLKEIRIRQCKYLDNRVEGDHRINQILIVDLAQLPHLQKYRHLLVFDCLTGLRFSYLSVIRTHDVRAGMLYKKQTETKHHDL